MLELYSHPPRLSRAAFLLLVFVLSNCGIPQTFFYRYTPVLFDLSFRLIVCDSSFLVEICPPAHHSLSTIILPDGRYNLRHIRCAWARPYIYRTSHNRLRDTHLGPVHTNVFSKVWVFVCHRKRIDRFLYVHTTVLIRFRLSTLRQG